MTPLDDASFGTIPLPPRLSRRMRLGPFPSARDALKFLVFAAVGAILAARIGPIAWIPFLGGGFLLSVYKDDDRGLDDRLWAYLAWRCSQRRGSGPGPPGLRVRGSVAHLPGGPDVGVLAASGVPVAFLPPSEARRLFDQYRELLRSLDGGGVVHISHEPLDPRPFLPPNRPSTDPAELAAREGYREMVQLLCRRRNRRRSLMLLWSDARRGARTLEQRLADAEARIAAVGVPVRRLSGPELLSTLHRAGYPGGLTA